MVVRSCHPGVFNQLCMHILKATLVKVCSKKDIIEAYNSRHTHTHVCIFSMVLKLSLCVGFVFLWILKQPRTVGIDFWKVEVHFVFYVAKFVKLY